MACPPEGGLQPQHGQCSSTGPQGRLMLKSCDLKIGTRPHLQSLYLPCAQLQHHGVLLQLLLPPASQLVHPCQLCLQGLAAGLCSRLTAQCAQQSLLAPLQVSSKQSGSASQGASAAPLRLKAATEVTCVPCGLLEPRQVSSGKGLPEAHPIKLRSSSATAWVCANEYNGDQVRLGWPRNQMKSPQGTASAEQASQGLPAAAMVDGWDSCSRQSSCAEP